METATRSDSLTARSTCRITLTSMEAPTSKTCERFELSTLTGRPWLTSLEGRFSVDISLCRYAIASREKQKWRSKLRTTRTAVCVTCQSHEVFFRDGLSKRAVDFEKQWKVMSQATGVRRLCCRVDVCGGLVSERSRSAQVLWTVRRRLPSGRISDGGGEFSSAR